MKKKRKVLKWKNLVKIGVSGSRRFQNPDLATQWLDQYIRKKYGSIDKVVIISGGFPYGIDRAIEEWCDRRGIFNLRISPKWASYEPPPGSQAKNPAGVIRNQHIIDLCDEFYAFWDGESPGTRDAIRRAKKKANRHGNLVRVFGINELRKELRIKPPVHVIVPKTASQKQARKMASWVRDADLVDLFRKEEIKSLPKINLFKRKGKKRKIIRFPQEEINLV